jgi:hypothetical protein
VNDRCELVDGVTPEDGIVRVYEVNNVNGDDFSSHGSILPKGHIDINFAKCLNSFVTEAV